MSKLTATPVRRDAAGEAVLEADGQGVPDPHGARDAAGYELASVTRISTPGASRASRSDQLSSGGVAAAATGPRFESRPALLEAAGHGPRIDAHRSRADLKAAIKQDLSMSGWAADTTS